VPTQLSGNARGTTLAGTERVYRCRGPARFTLQNTTSFASAFVTCSSPVLHTPSATPPDRPDYPYTPRPFEYQSTRQGSNGITTPSYPLSQAPYTLLVPTVSPCHSSEGVPSAVLPAGNCCLLYSDGTMLPVNIGSDVCRNMFASFKYGG